MITLVLFVDLLLMMLNCLVFVIPTNTLSISFTIYINYYIIIELINSSSSSSCNNNNRTESYIKSNHLLVMLYIKRDNFLFVSFSLIAKNIYDSRIVLLPFFGVMLMRINTNSLYFMIYFHISHSR